jgi:hypothetical protein
MSRTTAPLLSFGASGQIAKTQVYSTWKGRPYVRRYAIPSNPNTVDQQETRNTFSWLNAVWKYMPAGALDAWNAYATASRFTARNGFIKQNLSNLRSASDLSDFLMSPAAGGGLVAAGISVTPGAGQLTVTLTAPGLPTGWTISKAIAAALRQQDPQSGVLYTVSSAEDATAPYAPIITGLTASQVYVVGAWFEYIKPDGTFAYGPALMSTGTPS